MIIHWLRRQYHRAQHAIADGPIGVWVGIAEQTGRASTDLVVTYAPSDLVVSTYAPSTAVIATAVTSTVVIGTVE